MIHSSAKVHPSSIIDKNAQIFELVVISTQCVLTGNIKIHKKVRIGHRVQIYGNVEIEEESYIGDNVLIGHPDSSNLNIIRQSYEMFPGTNGSKVIIGENCVVRSGCIIYSDVEIGSNVSIGHNAMIREKTKIGSNSIIGTNTVIDGYTTIGGKVSIQTNVYIPTNTKIEDGVFIGPNCVITNDKYVMRKEFKLQGPVIKRDASIGANSTILPALTIGYGALIGAGTVVTKDVSPKVIVVGTPAHVLKQVPEDWIIPSVYREKYRSQVIPTRRPE